MSVHVCAHASVHTVCVFMVECGPLDKQLKVTSE